MGKEEGFVKIYRSLIDDPIWLNSTPAQKAVLITLMCMVTWKPRKWDVLGKPITLKPGQCFTSLSEIALRLAMESLVRSFARLLHGLKPSVLAHTREHSEGRS